MINMKKYISLLFALVVSMFAISSFAFTPPPAPASGWYVSDQAGKLDPAQVTQLNQKIERISKATKNEFGILLLQDMGGDNIEDVANATFKAWGIGKHGLDNGCLIVVAIKEHKTRIETGKGVEGEVTDLQASDILAHQMRPQLRAGNFAGGFNDTLDALSSLMESRQNKAATPAPAQPATSTATSSSSASQSSGCDVSTAGGGSGLLTLLVLGACGAVLLLFRRHAKKRAAEREDAMRAAAAEFDAQRREASRLRELRLQADLKDQERNRVAREARELAARNAAAVVAPVIRNTVPRVETMVPPPKPVTKTVVAAAAVTAVAAAAALEAEHLAAKHRRDREEEEARQRRQREQDDEDRRRRQREEDDRSSSSSSSSWGSSSSDSGFGGGGFGGGDSGGGGASSDW